MRRNPFHVVQTIELAIKTENNYLISSGEVNIFERPIILRITELHDIYI